MRSSLLNSPHPNLIGCTTFGNRGNEAYRERELKARAYYLERAAKGDAEAKLVLKTHPRWRLRRWYRRGVGEIL